MVEVATHKKLTYHHFEPLVLYCAWHDLAVKNLETGSALIKTIIQMTLHFSVPKAQRTQSTDAR